MALKTKLDLLNLSEEERKKAQIKFLATLSLLSEEELKEEIEFLASKGVKVTKAKDIKVFADTVSTMSKKFSILSEIHEEKLYSQEPSQLTKNAIDVYKKMQYCKQMGKAYKKEDGSYETFLFNEQAWNKEFNREEAELNEDIVTLQPEAEPSFDNVVYFSDDIEPVQSFEESDFEKTIQFESLTDATTLDSDLEDTKHIDINVYKSAAREINEISEKTTDLQTVREELEHQLKELDSLKNLTMEDEISFADLEPETYGMGRAAWNF